MTNPYTINNQTVPNLFGRSQILDEIRGRLDRVSPVKLQLVGPQFIGKTTIAHQVNEWASGQSSLFCRSILIRLDRRKPRSDDEFFAKFYAELRKSFSSPANASTEEIWPILFEEHDKKGLTLDNVERNTSNPRDVLDAIDEISEEISNSESVPCLVILDKFDYLKPGAHISSNVLDSLNDLFVNRVCHFITTNRQDLWTLCADDATRASLFNNDFELVKVKSFTEADCQALAKPITELIGESDSVSIFQKIRGLCGTHPKLNVYMAHHVYEAAKNQGNLDEALQDQCKEDVIGGHIRSIAYALPDESADLLRRLASEPKSANDVVTSHAEPLLDVGVVEFKSNKYSISSSLVARFFSGDTSQQYSTIRNIFQEPNFDECFRQVLQMQLSNQKNRISTDFPHSLHFTNFIENQKTTLKLAFTDSPTDAIRNLRNVELKFYDWFRHSELEEGRRIPETWLSTFEEMYSPALHDRPPKGYGPFKVLTKDKRFNKEFPYELLDQLRVFAIATGNVKKSVKLTRYANKLSYPQLLLLHEATNLGQHLGFDLFVSNQHVFSAITACITVNEQILQSVELKTFS